MSAPERHHGIILVADDNDLNRELLSTLLTKEGYQVVWLLCSRPHNNRYVALVKMRLWTPKDAVFNALASVEHHITSGIPSG